jgi:phosphomannomutase
MALIKSISGIRGTIGGSNDDGLNPVNIVKFTAAFAAWLRQNTDGPDVRVVVGRDARISGEMVSSLVIGTLTGMGIDVVNIGLATTPTTEIAVVEEKAAGGIILTASHNPKHWNALKLLKSSGEFLNGSEGKQVLDIADSGEFDFADVDDIGKVTEKEYTSVHIQQIIDLELVDPVAIREADFSVAVDAVNSVGGIAMPMLLRSLGVDNLLLINCEPDGNFAHNPEPVKDNLLKTSEIIQKSGVDVCFVVDPDVDRLVIINEDGSFFDEEYTLVAVADFVLGKTPGNTVSNLSSSRALRDITVSYGQTYTASAVGEVNVVEKMKETNAVIGGEGNGGVIYPSSHYGRDALVGAALFLTHLAKSGMKCSDLRKKYPYYFMSKNKIALDAGIDTDSLLLKIRDLYKEEKVNDIDGVKIDFAESWVHLRKSNTEPIIRIYTEAKSEEKSIELSERVMRQIENIARQEKIN